MTEQQRRTTQFLQFYILMNFLFSSLVSGKSSQPFCAWDSKAGAHYNIQPLMLPQGSNSAYQIVDGDIPCTPEIEPAFGYSWNFCDNVPSTQVPIQCKNQGKTGVVLQYVSIGGEDFCYILGHYDSSQHEIAYSQLDPADPSKGISLRFPAGEKCSSTNKKIRTATIDIQCANVQSVVVSAQEPAMCEYHLSMKSYYGCPTECPVTANGLCNSHGHCAYDKKAQKPYCYCNSGYAGAACDESASSSSKNDTYDGYSVQLGLLITLLILALGLTGGVVYLAYRVAEFRKTQINSHYTSLPGESEMVETLTFSR